MLKSGLNNRVRYNAAYREADQKWQSTWNDPGKLPELIEVLSVQLEAQARKGSNREAKA